MRNWTIPSVLFLLCIFSLLPDQGRNIHANAAFNSGAPVDQPKVEEKIGAVPHGSSTDSDVAKREAESMSRRTLRASAEKFEFQAEVSRLMDIIINSLYSNKDIFLRELISNASDALDKIRFLSLTDKEILGEGDTSKLEIQIKLDKDKKILSIRDRGIGMTKEDLIKNLGTIAKSGTSAFVEKMQKSGDLNLIGQFGVGFYSVYLVADYVEVITKHNDDKQYVWESKADGAFAISEDSWNEPIGRGTEIRLHLRDEAGEYLDQYKLKDLVKRYSEFINFPIHLWASKEVDKEVPVDEDESSDEDDTSESTSSGEETDDEDAEKGEDEKKPKTKKVKETTYEWELLNDVKAIWLRNPKEVTEEEYKKFYHSLAKDFSDEKPLAWSHFTAEGDVEFKAVLFVPHKAPHNLYERYYNPKKSDLKLYVRRVFISDEFDDLLPKYLKFLTGLVDSDTLPLNVSREMLQQHSSLKTIKKKLIRKALDMIRRLADEDPDESSDKDKKEVEESSDDNEKRGQYAKFWNELGKSIKLGIIEDTANRNRLAKLLRFETTKSEGELTSLDKYISRMKSGQKDIFYLTGTSKEQLENSPFLERLKKKNYEVILFTDPVDEYLVQYLMEYEDKKFQDVSKEGLKIKGSKDKLLKESFKDLTKWWKKSLASDNVDDVKISSRLADSPCVVVASKYGWSANMERIMQSQTLSDTGKQAYMRGKRALEINPRHPIIKELRVRVAKDPEDESVKQTAQLIYQTALMESGFILNDPKDFASRIYGSVKSSLKINPDAAVEEEEEAEETEAETSAKETDSSPQTNDVKDEL
ncbi:endoplasmin homolog [Ipomoea triloba]|uniref:endoplasmin homolog n=1 Tax=Ipomoea triloba TaxID=35885 RepID=UPI00125D3E47|nr:endoplasmin homolog [Ipomoea triloba]